MNPITPQSRSRRWLGAVLGALAGVWGVTAILVFGYSQAQMITPDTPIDIVIGSFGLILLILALQGLGYIASGVIAILAGANRVRNSRWLWLMLVFAVAMIGLSLIPFSSMALVNLPAAVGLLASGLLLGPRLASDTTHTAQEGQAHDGP